MARIVCNRRDSGNPKRVRPRIVLPAIFLIMASLLSTPAVFADSITANFDISIANTIVTSQGQLTLTLQPDGSILGKFAVNPSNPGEFYINMDMNVVAPTTLSDLTITYLGPSNANYPLSPCAVTLAGVNGCPMVTAAGPGGVPFGDFFGVFTFQLDSNNGENLTDFQFSITKPGGFTSVDSLVALSGGGSDCNPSFPFYTAKPACGNVDFQLFSNGDTVGAVAVSNPSSTSVPEPATWSLLLSGLATLAMEVRRRANLRA